LIKIRYAFKNFSVKNIELISLEKENTHFRLWNGTFLSRPTPLVNLLTTKNVTFVQNH